MISQELLRELKEIIKEDYKLDLSDLEVSELGYTLCNFFEQLAKTDCKKHHENENY
ncbi:MAG: hypothetical protein ABSE04_01685 [Candidatus Microgenomates bacterium]|jgi:hypothetical protein